MCSGPGSCRPLMAVTAQAATSAISWLAPAMKLVDEFGFLAGDVEDIVDDQHLSRRSASAVPMVTIWRAAVTAAASGAGIASRTIRVAPAFCKGQGVVLETAGRLAPALDLAAAQGMHRRGVRPMWPQTGMPRWTRNSDGGRHSAASSLTIWAPAAIRAAALRKAWAGDSW